MAHQCLAMATATVGPHFHGFGSQVVGVPCRGVRRPEVEEQKHLTQRKSPTVREKWQLSAVVGGYGDGHGGRSSVQVAARREGSESVALPMSVDHISSPNNPYLKHLVRLRQSAKARCAGSFVVVVGAIPLREICESVEECRRRGLIDVLLVKEDAEIPEGLASFSQRIVRVGISAMNKLSGLDSPPEAVGVLTFPSTFITYERCSDSASFGAQMRHWCSSPRRILVLDSIQDPGNLGTLIRTAAAFAWEGVFLLPGCCDPFNDKALRAARGAGFRVPIAVGGWSHLLQFASVNNLKLYAGDPDPDIACKSQFDAQTIFSQDSVEGVSGGLCLVLGSEGQGLSEEVRRDCSSIRIPMPGKFESLNVAVAGGILMFLLR